ncbi:tetratricopeptide repeat-containing sensor histidine kinase [uncultured Microscilla sp.]|uniref:ATP-binding protein n=1 Tax=uncultured Microscilla sp. TaxID=432653 RepID=UPI0026199694|nr:tetratricopeptide repeat-containing sensor histidine kinase [uncultured Microscilla sp.]
MSKKPKHEVALGELRYHQHQYEAALEHLRSVVDIAQRLNLPASLKEASRYLVQVYAALGKYKEAYQNHTLYKTLADSLVNQKNTRKIAQLETQYVYQQKQDSLKVVQAKKEGALQAEIQTQKANQRTVLIGAGFLGLLLIVLTLFYRSKQRSNRLLTSANAQLISLDGFKQQMIGMIVHDLKNPLNAIIGLSEDQQNPQFIPINRSGKRMQHLVLNILDVQRMEDQKMPLKTETISVDHFIQTAVSQVGFVMQEKNQQINHTTLPDPALLQGDVEVLTRVLVNLLINAIQHTTQNQAIRVTTALKDAYCKILVIDEGVGIAPEFLDKLFDKYQQANPKQLGWSQSTGLGLTFCKLAVEAHRGEIGVESTLGKGSTFWFTLPLAKTSASTPEKVEVSQKLQEPSEVTFHFTAAELKVLQPLAIEISQYQIYQTGDIIPLLDTLNQTNSEAIKRWQLAMKDAIFTYNKTTLEALLELVSTRSSTT